MGEGAPDRGRHLGSQTGRAALARAPVHGHAGEHGFAALDRRRRAGDRFDRALWTATAAVTGGAGNSNALVGTPETVAEALLDYYDLGIEILSARGYDILEDAIEFGRDVIPIVRAEVAKRDRERARLDEGAVAARAS